MLNEGEYYTLLVKKGLIWQRNGQQDLFNDDHDVQVKPFHMSGCPLRAPYRPFKTYDIFIWTSLYQYTRII